MRHVIATLILTMSPVLLVADTLTFSQVKHELDTESVLPLFGNVDVQLSKNLLSAQAQASYASTTSLELSIQAVLKAIGLYVWDGGPASITSEAAEPIVWAQSRVAINPVLTGTLGPASVNFGEVVVTSEPGVLSYLAATLLLMLIVPLDRWIVKRYTKDL